MPNFRTMIALSVLLSAYFSVPTFAATTMSVKVGYFNLQLVKSAYPESAGSESLRIQAENQLRRDVEEGNKMLQKLQTENKPKEEVEKKAKELQIEINAKQKALIQLVQTQQAIANQTISQAVNQVAKDKGLDLILDGAGVFAGGDKVVSNGDDITDAIVKKLAPAVLNKPSEKPAASESKPAAGTTK